MLSEKLILNKDHISSSDEIYEPRSYQCTPLDKTFACGFVVVMTIVGVTLYVALNFSSY